MLFDEFQVYHWYQNVMVLAFMSLHKAQMTAQSYRVLWEMLFEYFQNGCLSPSWVAECDYFTNSGFLTPQPQWYRERPGWDDGGKNLVAVSIF